MLSVITNVVKTLKMLHAPLVMVSHYNAHKYKGGHTIFQDGSNDTTFDPPSMPLDSTFKPFCGELIL